MLDTINVLFENSLIFAVIVAVPTDILVKVVKNIGVSKKWLPLLSSLVFGPLSAFVLSGYDYSPMTIVAGVLGGALACGIFDALQTPLKK